MVRGYIYVIICAAIVGIGGFAMLYFLSSQTQTAIITPKYQGTFDCIRYYPQAEKLVENSIGQATISSYNLQNVGIQCFLGNAPDGTRILLGVKLDYQSNNPSIGTLTVIEDPQLTKIINATVIPALRLGGSTG